MILYIYPDMDTPKMDGLATVTPLIFFVRFWYVKIVGVYMFHYLIGIYIGQEIL